MPARARRAPPHEPDRRPQTAISPGCRWGTTLLPGDALTREDARRAGGKPVWDVIEAWLKSRPGGRVAPRQIDAPKLVGVDGNPGLGGTKA